MITFEEARPAIQQWLRGHDIDPDFVPYTARPVVRPDGSVRLPMYARNEAGAKHLDAEGEIAMSEVVIHDPGLTPSPVQAWLRGEIGGTFIGPTT